MYIGTVISSVGGSISNFSYGDITVFKLTSTLISVLVMSPPKFASQAKYIYTDSSSLIERYLSSSMLFFVLVPPVWGCTIAYYSVALTT